VWWFLGIALATGTELEAHLSHFIDEPQQVEALVETLDSRLKASSQKLVAIHKVDPVTVEEFLLSQIADNLAAKKALTDPQPFVLSVEEIERTVFDYEIFKLESYVSSGVFPKRYFGYFDLKHDTAQWEWELREATHCATEVINTLQAERGSPLRVNDAEIAVTFIAEGGALFLLDEQESLNSLHPVYDVGLDDLASGHHDYPELIPKLDASCGTDLSNAVVRTAEGAEPPAGAIGRLQAPPGEWAWTMRNLRFKEGIVASAMMWIWEKEIAARKLEQRGGKSLHQRDVADQFIVGSLAYNSGIVHSESTIAKIRTFSAGPYLWERSEQNASRKPRLNLLPPPKQLEHALASTAYSTQDTSWIAAYHILQRYGAWEALRRFTDVFDESGTFKPRERPQVAAKPVDPPTGAKDPAPDPAPEKRGCRCSATPQHPTWGLLSVLILWFLILVFRHKMPWRLPNPRNTDTVNKRSPLDVRRT
jgi:hypothetical protein